MLKRIIFFFYCSMALVGYANDPFDHKQRKLKNTEQMPTVQKTKNNCYKTETILASHIDFEQLTLIGVIENPQYKQAFFLDSTQKIWLFSERDVFAKEALKLEMISLNKVKIIDGKHNDSGDCRNAKVIELTL
ncbi:hypothetical protein ACLSYV_08580 [Avibacterium avium]|uniref:hypothetical protein n=1 Tax=Avibacterium avium TaxID=751 RepID=UPI003BF836FB